MWESCIRLFQGFLEGTVYDRRRGDGCPAYKQLPFSKKLKGAELLFDGFTGFTPIQVNVIRELLVIADRVCVTVTMDEREDAFTPGKPHQLFFMSKQMIRTLAGLTKNLDDPVYLKPIRKIKRFAQAPAIAVSGEESFAGTQKGSLSEEEQSGDPRCLRRLRRLAEMRGDGQENGTAGADQRIPLWGDGGDHRESGGVCKTCGRRSLKRQKIPYFIDEKHSVLMNPFVEYLRAAMEMAVQGFPYESVFRYLRCGMSEVTREQADKLENYVLALGIRGYRKVVREMGSYVPREWNRIRSRS